MKRSLRSTLVFLLCSTLSSVMAQARAPDPASPIPTAGSANREFAVDLYRHVAAEPGNVFVSPWSIRSALGMVYAGARTRTEAGMMRALHDPFGQWKFHSEASRLDASLLVEGVHSGSEVLAANAVWLARDLRLEAAFQDTLATRYSAPARRIDFANGEAARATINAWVEEQTHTRIRDLIPKGSLNGDTRLVLCNAVYFKAAWQDSFRPLDTVEAPFHRSNGQAVQVHFMNATRDLRLCHGSDADVLELPYRGGSMGMLIVLPKDPNSLSAVERALDPDTVQSWNSRFRPEFVHVALPRFRLETAYELSSILGHMGMGDAFTPQADFSGIARERPLFVGQVFHKAYVQVDERGTEAAGATAALMYRGSGPDRSHPFPFIADHPFLFLIRSRTTGAILFMGRVENPS